MSETLPLIFLNIHVLTGYICLIVGVCIMFLKKGNALHKTLGRFYVVSGLILVFTAFAAIADLALNKEYIDFNDDFVNVYSFQKSSYALTHFIYFTEEYFALIVINVFTLYLITTGWFILQINRANDLAKKIIQGLSFVTITFLIFAVIMLYISLTHDVTAVDKKANVNLILTSLLVLLPFCYHPLLEAYRLGLKRKILNRQDSIISHFSRMNLAFGAILSAFLLRWTDNQISFFHWIPIVLVLAIMLFFRLRFPLWKKLK